MQFFIFSLQLLIFLDQKKKKKGFETHSGEEMGSGCSEKEER
jgi:hypothetical protein